MSEDKEQVGPTVTWFCDAVNSLSRQYPDRALGPEVNEFRRLLGEAEAIFERFPSTGAAIAPDLQQKKMNMTIHELGLWTSTRKCLQREKIQTVRDLVKKTDADLIGLRGFGHSSLHEVKRRLADMGLSLGMTT